MHSAFVSGDFVVFVQVCWVEKGSMSAEVSCPVGNNNNIFWSIK